MTMGGAQVTGLEAERDTSKALAAHFEQNKNVLQF